MILVAIFCLGAGIAVGTIVGRAVDTTADDSLIAIGEICRTARSLQPPGFEDPYWSAVAAEVAASGAVYPEDLLPDPDHRTRLS